MAAGRRAVFRFWIFVLILMAVFLPLAQSSRPQYPLNGGGVRVTKESTQKITEKEFHKMEEAKRFDDRASFVMEKRKVPTGPDPLHHNDNPTGP